ncbi:[SSU ribosomal protein S18P]-alanine acetyltransferase [Natranaerovirga pectinivora]|uniref:[Ribosomal protein bS18]-alanine N-acetyltransferase n=1 Tax=Natranaerovirga pectinivora TaxID=682400 RepID=A0A4R3MJV8_9FIRM|nr:ribosomal protein S18-alanine N-acetyltransferase [Natranaerovirga pectinivora]TCT13777.1 [SSU ribosomal protein S18P]-alanine acetyltransferase [Natranaerovirga pectinivora]
MISFRGMILEDIDQIVEIEEMSFTNPWTKKAFEDELVNKLALYIVAISNNEVIGYGGIWKIYDEGHITNIAIRKTYRGKGIGKLMVQELIKAGKKKGIDRYTLEVRESNIIARKLYKDLGFEEIGLRRNYYTKPVEHAVIMWKNT